MLIRNFAGLLAALVASNFFFANLATAAQLNYGKYFGTIQMDGRAESIAVSLDAFVVQIKDPTVYPALNVIIRANLGGYTSSEYVGFSFYDPTFNFEQGILQLDDARGGLSATLAVTNTDTQTILEGPILYRMTNSKGRMRVILNSDEAESPLSKARRESLLSVLKGEYRGTCGGDPAELQIETGRSPVPNPPGNALIGYSITGRLGFTKGVLCSSAESTLYCSHTPFSTGTYSPFSGRLTMQGPLGTIDCNKKLDELECTFVAYDKNGACKLSKKSTSPTDAMQTPANIFLNVSSDQKKPLPVPLPPGNDELVKALNGDFFGFLHFENRDIYQLMQMSIIATTSTENPHVQNQVMVTPTITLRLGSSWAEPPALSLFYPQRVFWMNAGFAFQTDDGDFIAVINEWRSGYVSGVFYSRSFGRVGTFEMQKGSAPPAPREMTLALSPVGDFHGPINSPERIKNAWELSIQIPNQVPGPEQTGIPLIGRFGGHGVANMFEAASLDLNTGSMSLVIRNAYSDRLVTGEVLADGKLSLLWPVGSVMGAPMADYQEFTYIPVKQK